MFLMASGAPPRRLSLVLFPWPIFQAELNLVLVVEMLPGQLARPRRRCPGDLLRQHTTPSSALLFLGAIFCLPSFLFGQ